jgi:nitroreductase
MRVGVCRVSCLHTEHLLQSVEEGIGGVWLGIYPVRPRMKILQEAFNLPETVMPFSAIPLGYSERINKPANRFDPFKNLLRSYHPVIFTLVNILTSLLLTSQARKTH